MLKKLISRVFIVITLIAFFQIAGTVILARSLPKPEMGLYRLLLTIAELGSLVSLMGIDHAFVRFFSSPEVSFDKYDWQGFLKSFSYSSFIIIIAVSLIVNFIYKFSPFAISSLFILLIMLASISIFSALLRAGHQYELSIFLNRLNFLIFFALLIPLYILKLISFENTLLCYVAAAVLANLIIVCFYAKNTPSGIIPIPISVLKNGFYYFGLSISILLIGQTGYLMIGKMLSYKDLAVYAVIYSTMRIFEFVQDSSYYVLAPYLNKRKEMPGRRIFLHILFIGALVALLYILFAKPIIHFLFKGNYDEGVYLVPLFVGIGLTRTLFVFPSSIIGGSSSESALRNQFYLTILAAILNIYLTYVLIQKWGLRGVALASLLTWLIVFISSLLVTKTAIRN